MPKINQGIVENIPIPLPPLDTQGEIVAELEAERKLVEGNRELITRMEKKIEAMLSEIWGDEPAPAGNDGPSKVHIASVESQLGALK